MHAHPYRFLTRAALWIALCAVLAETAAGTTYYVRKSGKNSNAGTTAALAFLTIDKAANVAVAGDVVYVGAGVYAEAITPSHDGASGSPIQFIADTTGAMTGDAGNVDVNKSGGTLFNISGDNYIYLIGFRVYGGATGVNVTNTTGSLIQNCEIYNATADGMKCNNAVSVTINNCTIYSNASYGIDVQGTSSVTVSNCTIRANGNGVHTDDAGSGVTLLKCRIYSNTNRGVFSKKGIVTIKNSLIYSNGGEGVYAETPSGPTITIWNTTIANNTLDGIQQKSGTLTLTNSILSRNTLAGLHYVSGTLTHTYNLLYGNSGGAYSGTTAGTGEVASDPKFTNEATYDYHLGAGSPAINHGTNAAGIVDDDLDGNARPINSGWDMGAYESHNAGSDLGVRITKWQEIQ